MATSTINITDDAYVLVSSAADALAQNISSYPVEFLFAASLPAANTVGHKLFYGQAVQKSSGVPSDNLYMKAEPSALGNGNAVIAVSE